MKAVAVASSTCTLCHARFRSADAGRRGGRATGGLGSSELPAKNVRTSNTILDESMASTEEGRSYTGDHDMLKSLSPVNWQALLCLESICDPTSDAAHEPPQALGRPRPMEWTLQVQVSLAAIFKYACPPIGLSSDTGLQRIRVLIRKGRRRSGSMGSLSTLLTPPAQNIRLNRTQIFAKPIQSSPHSHLR